MALPWALPDSVWGRCGLTLFAAAAALCRARGTALSVGLLTGLLLSADAAARVRDNGFGLPGPGFALESSWSGQLLQAPLRAAADRWVLRLSAVPERGPSAVPRPLSVSVGVGHSGPGLLQDLRAGDQVSTWLRVGRARRHPGRLFARCKSPRLIELTSRGGASPRRWASQLRRTALDRLRAAPGPARGRRLLAAICLGARESLEPTTRSTLQAAGLAHLIAISGLHVGWALLPLGFVSGRLPLPPPMRWLLTSVAVALFCLGVGARPSVLRAGIAVCLTLGARHLLGLPMRTVSALPLVAVVLLSLRPDWCLDAGFQLSCVATAALLHGTEPLRQALRLGTRWGRVAAAGLAVHAATAPLTALHFGLVAPASPWLNFVALPLALGALGFGTLGLLLPAAWGGARWIALASECADMLARTGAWIDGTALMGRFAASPGWGWLAALIIAVGIVRRQRRTADRHRAATLVAGIVLMLLHVGPPPPRGPGAWVLDVGQGQAVLLLDADGRAVLVDAGGPGWGGADPGLRRIGPRLALAGIRRIDTMVLSHGHLDHVSGAATLLHRLEVGALWIGSDEPALRAIAASAGQGCAVRSFKRDRQLGRLVPPIVLLAAAPETACTSVNDRSVLVRFDRELLIAGDIERCGEQWHARSPSRLRAKRLVLSHHGSGGASTPAFLDAVAPDEAFVSAGFANRFGHPDRQVQHRLRRRGIRLRRTDLEGEITVRGLAGRRRAESGRARSDVERSRDQAQPEDQQNGQSDGDAERTW